MGGWDKTSAVFWQMRTRILTGLALIPPVVYVLGWAPEWLFIPVLIAVAELCLYEYFSICRHAGFRPMAKLGYGAGALICLLPGESFTPLALEPPFFIGLLLLVLSVGMVRATDLKDYPGKVACTFLGLIYIPCTLATLVPIRFHPADGLPGFNRNQGRFWMLLLFAVIWGGDILAYFLGRTLGRTRLAPRISPNKTVVGAVGGLLGSGLAALGVKLAFLRVQPGPTLGALALIVLLTALAGQVGDLAESALKRGAGIKDSGALLPGHGGMLDRLDSLLFAAPMLWLVLSVGSR